MNRDGKNPGFFKKEPNPFGFFRVLLGLIGLFWVLLGFSGFYFFHCLLIALESLTP